MAFPPHRSTVIQGFFLGNRPCIQIPHHRTGAVQLSPARGPAIQLPPAMLNLRPSPSQRLPEAIQRKMETLFRADFSDVRVHVGQEAASIGALAFTHGPDLYFAPGQYNPNSPHGQRLLGHELAHVLQQKSGRVRNPFGSGLAVVQDPGLEAEAERLGLRAATVLALPELRPRIAQAKPVSNSPARPPFAKPSSPSTSRVSHLSKIRPVIALQPTRRPARRGATLVRRRETGVALQPKHHYQKLNSGMYMLAYSLLDKAVTASVNGNHLWDLTRNSDIDHLIFEDAQDLDNETMAETIMRIGDQTFSKDVDTPGDVLKGLDRNSNIAIFIRVNPDHKDAGNTAICAETLVHEYALHAIPFLPLITSWRNKNIRIEQIADYWQSSRYGGKNDPKHQHYLLATDTSEDFVSIRREMEALLTRLAPPEVAESFRREVAIDINDHSDYRRYAGSIHRLDRTPVSFIL
jgi:Domain of unknown function (DUF4157)